MTVRRRQELRKEGCRNTPRRPNAALRGLTASLARPQRIAARVSVVSVAELFASFRGAMEQADIGRLLAECQVLPITEDVAREAGLLKNKYLASHSVELPDAMIAATAMAHGLALYILDVKHCPMVADLAPAYPRTASTSPAGKSPR